MWELLKTINEATEKYIKESNAIKVTPEEIGLNNRCGELLISTKEGWIATKDNSINYHGGFEYIDSELVDKIGEYTFYAEDAHRVQVALDYFKEYHQHKYINNTGR